MEGPCSWNVLVPNYRVRIGPDEVLKKSLTGAEQVRASSRPGIKCCFDAGSGAVAGSLA